MNTLEITQQSGPTVVIQVPPAPGLVEVVTPGPPGPPGTPGNEHTEMNSDPLAYYILAKS